MTAVSVTCWVQRLLVRALTIAMPTSTPQTARRLPAAHPEVARTLTTLAPTPLSWPGVLVIQPRGGPKRKRRSQQILYFCVHKLCSPGVSFTLP
jgi:hypothetical protein